MKSVYDTAPWREGSYAKDGNKNSKNKIWRRHFKNKKNTKRSKIIKHLKRNSTFEHDFDGFHPDHLTKEEKGKDGKRIADTKFDLFGNPFEDFFSRMPAFADFLLTKPNTRELARTPRHFPAADVSDRREENPRAGKTSQHRTVALPIFSPNQVFAVDYIGEGVLCVLGRWYLFVSHNPLLLCISHVKQYCNDKKFNVALLVSNTRKQYDVDGPLTITSLRATCEISRSCELSPRQPQDLIFSRLPIKSSVEQDITISPVIP